MGAKKKKRDPTLECGMSYTAALKELQQVSAFIDCQADAGVDRSMLVGEEFLSWKEQLGAMGRLSQQQVTDLTKAANGGPWSATQKTELATLIRQLGKANKKEANPCVGRI